MTVKQKVIMFVLLAGVASAFTSYTASIPNVKPIFIVLPLVLMGFFLFFAGYFAGLSRKSKK